MRKIIAALLAAFCVIAGIALVRVARFSSRQLQPPPAETITTDRRAIANRLSQAIQYETVSYQEPDASAAASNDASPS